MSFRIHRASFIAALCMGSIYLSAQTHSAQTVDLPSSKQLVGEVPGHP
jgi:hypothetical protein